MNCLNPLKTCSTCKHAIIHSTYCVCTNNQLWEMALNDYCGKWACRVPYSILIDREKSMAYE